MDERTTPIAATTPIAEMTPITTTTPSAETTPITGTTPSAETKQSAATTPAAMNQHRYRYFIRLVASGGWRVAVLGGNYGFHMLPPLIATRHPPPTTQ